MLIRIRELGEPYISDEKRYPTTAYGKIRYIVKHDLKEPELPKAQKRGVGYTRKNRSQPKKARKQAKISRRRNR